MRRFIVVIALASLLGCSTIDYFSRRVVARAGDQVLTTDWFAQTMADGTMPLQPTLLERWAWLWVQYSLYLQHLAEGDPLTDSAIVVEAMWPEVLTSKVARMHEQLVAEAALTDSALIDSAYAAGDHRIIDHVLVRTGTSLTASQKEQQRRKAQRIHDRLMSDWSWDRAVQQSEDPETIRSGGRLGIISRGQTVPPFEQAAYDLAPGAISEVVETRFGFHILRRPHLDEVRQEFADRISDLLASRWRDGMVDEMAERRNVRVNDDAPEIMKDAAARPLRVLALEPGKVIATYDGGELTDVGFVQWLQVMPRTEHLSVGRASDEELMEMARRVVNNNLLRLEVEERGVELAEADYREYRDRYLRSLRNLNNALGVDSLMAGADSETERNRIAREALERYMVRTAQNQRNMAIVPPLLAAILREEGDWSFFYGGLNRAVNRAVELREVSDSTTTP